MKELYACVYVREFAAQAMLRLRPELRQKAVVVLSGEPPMETVCSLNVHARRLGLEHGMTKVETETFSSIALLRRSIAEESAARAAMLECAGTFSPRVESHTVQEDVACVVDIAGTEKLFGTPQAMAQGLRQRMHALGMSATVAVSRNFHAAMCHARGHSVTAVLEDGGEAAALAGLPLAVLDLNEERAATFAAWGIATLGELAALPEKDLAARLGQDAMRWQKMARGELPHLFVPVEPEFLLVERMELDTPVELLEPLLFVMGAMLEQLVLRATERALALAAVTLTFTLEGGGTHVRRVRPALASNDRQMWLKLIHLDLNGHPPAAAVLGLAMEAEPGHSSKVQMGLFMPQLPEPGRLDVTLARIKGIVGEENVGRAVLEDTHRTDGFRVDAFTVEPLRVKCAELDGVERTPMALRQIRPRVNIAMHVRGDVPAGFVFREKRYEVERTYGPWTSSGEWWSHTLWGTEQWDLIARSADGGVLCCCVTREGEQRGWHMAALYD